MSINPKCKRCQDTNPENFYLDRNKGEGHYQTYCKSCTKLQRAEWAKKNPEKEKEYRQKYYRNLKEDPEKWHQHLARLNRDKNAKRLYTQVQNANRRARKRGVKGKLTVKEWKKLILKYDKCPGCNLPWSLSGRPTLDHIIPLAKRGINEIKNIQPLCWSCHGKKVLAIKRFRKEKKKNV